MINKQKNVVAYVRVSTSGQVDGFSIEAQQTEIYEYCKRNELNLIETYIDSGITGTSIEKRLQFQQMLSDISEKKEINSVIVWKLSRLSRKMTHLVNTIEFFEKYNVNLISITDGIDTSNKYGKSFVFMAGIFAEIERDNIVETCKMGMKERATQGKWNGGKVLGYESNSEKELIINEKEAKTVEQIFKLFGEEEWGFKKIASYLNYEGKKTIKEKSWSINSIKQVIDNPLYVGFIRWGKHVDWSTKRREGKSDEFVLIKGSHVPIISEELWNKVISIRELRNNISTKIYEGNFLLTSLIKCPNCGAPMISHRAKKKNKPGEYYRYYMCSNHSNKGGAVCPANLVDADYAERYVLNEISLLVKSPEVLKSILKKIENKVSTNTKPSEKALSELKKELKLIQDKILENLNLEYNSQISIETLNQRLSFLNNKEKEVLIKISELEQQLESLKSDTSVNPEFIKTILENFIVLFETADVEHKKKLLRSLIDTITINQGKTAKDRTINKIKLYFEPQEVEALSKEKKFASTYDTVHRTYLIG